MANSTDSEAPVKHIPFPSGKSNFFSGVMICTTLVIDSSHRSSIRNAARYAWNTADRNTVAHPAEEEQT